MVSTAISILEEELKKRLSTQAERSGRSTEEVARATLCNAAVDVKPEPENFAQFIYDCYAPSGGIELDLPSRKNA